MDRVNIVNKENDTFLLGLDLGTTAIKGVVVSRSGDVVAVAESKNVFLETDDDVVEFDPQLHYESVCEVIRQLSDETPGSISALAMAAASGNTLLTSSDGQPYTNIISWMDQRSAIQLPSSLKGLESKDVRQVVGWPCVTSFPLAHLAWLQENRSDLYSDASRYCMNTDWLLFKLTGKWAMDSSTATTFHLQDQVSGLYHKPYLDMLNIQEDQLSKLVASGASIGKLTVEAQRDTGLGGDTDVVTGCFDHPAAARAVGVCEPGQLMLSCGTSWVGFFPEVERQNIIDAELLCDPFLSKEGGPWGAIFSVPRIGRTIDWYVDNLIACDEQDKMKIFDESAATASAGADGLKIDLTAAPKVVNDSRENISRAVMEGAARLLNEKINTLADVGVKFNSAIMVGGPSRSPVWPKIVEEITGIRLTVGSAHAGAVGAALLAGK